ncbi:MAG: hypothetical protein P4L40_11835 [Terracidiphilus sp.]|nr:hypothetical protein [Terracidiphilus sp.]
MHTLDIFQWLSHSAAGQFMQKSQWAFAVVETVHLLALALLGGSLIAVSLRAIGLLRSGAFSSLARNLLPVTLASFAAISVTGVLMVSEEALKCYYSAAFRAKMLAFAIALIISVPVYAELVRRGNDKPAWWLRLGAALMLLSWLSVGVAGRAIGFL